MKEVEGKKAEALAAEPKGGSQKEAAGGVQAAEKTADCKECEALARQKAAYEEKLKALALAQAIKEAGGRNEKAILALLDVEAVQYDEEKGLVGLSLEAVKAEAPYLFEQKEEIALRGTGMCQGQKEKSGTAAAFRNALRR